MDSSNNRGSFHMKLERIERFSLLLLLCMLPVFFIFQGLDFTDMGYLLVSSRDTLSDPGNVASHLTFLSMFLNGLWLKISAPWGLLGARFGVVLVYWVIFFCSYIVLKDFMSERQVFAWLFLTFLFTQRSSWISYNNITSLFAVLSLSVLYSGYRCRKNSLFLISGGFCALALFARLPNISMIFFGFIPVVTQILFEGKFFDKKGWKQTGAFFAGYLGAVIIVIALMSFAGYRDYYFRSIVDILELSTKTDYHHSLGSLLGKFFEDYKRVFALGFVVVVTGTCFSVLLERFGRPMKLIFIPLLVLFSFHFGWRYFRGVFGMKTLVLLALLLFLYQLVILVKKRKSVIFLANLPERKLYLFLFISLVLFAVCARILYFRRATPYDPVIGVTYLVLFFSLFRAWRKEEKNFFFAILISLAMLVTVPLGSGNGIRNAVHGLWFSLPLSLSIIWGLGGHISLRGSFNKNSNVRIAHCNNFSLMIVIFILFPVLQ